MREDGAPPARAWDGSAAGRTTARGTPRGRGGGTADGGRGETRERGLEPRSSHTPLLVELRVGQLDPGARGGRRRDRRAVLVDVLRGASPA